MPDSFGQPSLSSVTPSPSESGHPLVGETVYVRDYLRQGRTPIPSDRLLLHAATLGLPHPVTGEPLRFSAELPPDFLAVVDRLR